MTTQPQADLKSTNRRATIRYQYAPATLGKIISSDREGFVRAYVIDLSKTGVGLLVPKSIPTNDEVIIQITSPTSEEKLEFVARLIHCSRQINEEWKVGCRFVKELTDDQLDQLL